MPRVPERTPLNIVPFIDIMLVLLCIVLSISTFVAQGKIEVNLPSSKSSAPVSNTENYRLEVNAQGQIYYEGTATTLDQLQDAWANLKPHEHVQLRIDEQASFAVFISIVDLLKARGHDNFSIATARKS